MDKTIYSVGQIKLQTLLRKIRKEKGYRQQDIAELLGVPQSFVSKYEAGERRLDILELREICRVLDLKLIDFIAQLENILDES